MDGLTTHRLSIENTEKGIADAISDPDKGVVFQLPMLVAGILIATLTASCGSSKVTFDTETGRYSNEAGGYSLTVPSDWFADSSRDAQLRGDGTEGYAILRPESNRKPPEEWPDPPWFQVVTFPAYTRLQWIETINSQPPYTLELEPLTGLSVGGAKGEKGIYADEADELRRLHVLVEHKGILYILEGVATSDQWIDMLPKFERIVSSFEYTNAPTLLFPSPTPGSVQTPGSSR